MSNTTAEPTKPADAPKPTLEEAVERARRAYALGHFDEAVDNYAVALELQTEKHGDHAPENADLYFAYGKALLEHAVSQSSVLGKEQAEDGTDDGPEDGATAGAFFSFSGDAEEEDDGEDNSDIPPPSEDVPVDLFAEANKAVEAEEAAERAEEEEQEDANDEPEDDFNAAWEILDLARSLFDKRKDEDDEIKLKLADTYVSLGDVSLETEKFEQAVDDYKTALALKTELLPASSRQLTEVHYKLCLVLDMTPGRLDEAIEHAQKAVDSTEARLEELRAALDGQAPVAEAPVADRKGKGKAGPSGLRLGTDLISAMTKAQVEAEIKDVEELRGELKAKMEELASPSEEAAVDAMSAPMLVAQALDRELNAGSASAVVGQTGKVNDLTGMVKKKKKADADANGTNGVGEKRKAEDDAPSAPEKRLKVEADDASVAS